jgi:hypothetical protein
MATGVKTLDCEICERGPGVVVNGTPLMVGCLSERAVDDAIALLKANLDVLRIAYVGLGAVREVLE